MVKLIIRDVAERRGIKSAYQLQKVMGVAPSVAARLWKAEMRMIGLDTIDALCAALDCEPGALFERKKGRSKGK
jgi:DNA-binding Xre family transcriptional regulator